MAPLALFDRYSHSKPSTRLWLFVTTFGRSPAENIYVDLSTHLHAPLASILKTEGKRTHPITPRVLSAQRHHTYLSTLSLLVYPCKQQRQRQEFSIIPKRNLSDSYPSWHWRSRSLGKRVFWNRSWHQMFSISGQFSK